MKISLINAGKRYNREWIFRNFSYEFSSGNSYAIIGPNGSGKSTLLQAIGGALMLSEGQVLYELGVGTNKINQEIEARSQEPGARSDKLTLEKEVGSQESLAISIDKVSENSPATNHKLQTSLTERQDTNSQVQPENIYQYLSIAAPYLELIEEMTVKEFLRFHQQFKPFLPSVTIDSIITTIGLEKASDKQIRYYSSGMKQRVKLAQAIFSEVALVLLDEPCTNLDAEGIALYLQLINEYCQQRLVIVSSNDSAEYAFCNERVNIVDYK